MNVLIAGMGNVLRRDDGFGVEIVGQLTDRDTLPAYVKVVEVGIGGIHLVQELMNGYDALVLIDAVERDSLPGTLCFLEPQVPDLTAYPEEARQDFLADTHYATPSKVLILAKALGVLPPKVLVVGCQPAEATELGIGLSEPVQHAAQRLLEQLESSIHVCFHPEPRNLDPGPSG